MIQHTLDFSVRLDNEVIEVDIYEPESGEVSQFQFMYSPDEHPEFDEVIGREIYSWISIWMDEQEGGV